MPLGDCLYRGERDALAALRAGNDAAAIAALPRFSLALEMLRDGRRADAITYLERELEPKWWSAGACQRAYDKAMAGKANPFMEKSL